MSVTQWAQDAAVAVAVTVSGGYVWLHFAPASSGRLRRRCGRWLDQPGRPTVLRTVGRRLLPSPGAEIGHCSTDHPACDDCFMRCSSASNTQAEPPPEDR